jgi:tRNA-modifying protein YgfZ
MKVDLPTPLDNWTEIDSAQCVELVHLAAIKIAGVDAEKFLQAQLSSHITQLAAKTPQLSAWCAANGRVLALGWLFRAEELRLGVTDKHMESVFPASPRESTFGEHYSKHLRSYPPARIASLNEECRIQESTFGEHYSQHLHSYPPAGIASVFPASPRESFIWFVARDCAEQAQLGLNKFKLRAKVTVTLSSECVLGSFEPDAASVENFRLPDGRILALAEHAPSGNTAALAREWRLRDIHQRIAWNGGHERFLPQMLGLVRYDGLSLKKGCFPGQEVIARLHYKGELKRDLRVLSCALPIAPGRYLCDAYNDSVEIIQSEGVLALAVVAKALPGEFQLGPENVNCVTMDELSNFKQ